ncbi:MAG: DUF1501 domain-containing protein [Planctomycetota bacterium]|nr:MAG: DUF1501 domain-containing protein [Planctomycetota bacterium]
MLRLCGPGTRLCDGVARREFLRAGGLALAGLTLPEFLHHRAGAAPASAPRAQRCLQLFMWGGPSQLETFDLKPQAPVGVRGVFRPAATNVPGTQICEHLPLLAQKANRYAILRSVTHTGVNHGTSAYHMLTGHLHATPGTLRHPTPNDLPSLGCAVSRFGRQPQDLPAYVALPSVLHDGDGGEVPGQGPGLLGQRYAPFYVHGDPTRPDFSIGSLTLPADVNGRRFRGRMDLQTTLEQAGEHLGRRPVASSLDAPYEQAFRLLQSPAARQAFHLAAEPAAVRERYGWHHFGQSCLLARRLLEAGVPLVTVYWNAPHIDDLQHWDTHKDSFNRLKNHLLPPFDRGMTALLDDLHTRGLLDDTLVVWMGEFGRTPKLNKAAGRDHWGFCQSVLMAGAGVRGGQVYGSSDASAAYAAESPVGPEDLAATVFHGLGIRLDQEMRDMQGRPLPLCTGKPVLGLF